MAEALVLVVFVDGHAGHEIGRARMPADELPDTFEARTTVDLDGTTWQVERADPSRADEFRAAGMLTLTVRRLGRLPARDILFSLPSICDELPAMSGGSAEDSLQIHEDEWREVELVSASLSDIVLSQLEAIRLIYRQHARRGADGRILGFDSIHVRSHPAQPLPVPVSRTRLFTMLPPADQRYSGVAFTDYPGMAAGSFAAVFGSVAIYGQADGDAVHVLCLRAQPDTETEALPALVRGLDQALGAFGAVLVDWRRCRVIPPEAVGEYLTAW